MVDLTSHPDESLLRSYLLGKLPDASMDSVEQHLAICETCAERSHELQPRDELVELVTAASSHGDSCYALTAHQTGMRLPNSETQTVSDLSTSTTHVDEEVPPTPQLPDQSRYRIIRFLGSGGMGQVWLAEHLVLGRRVALKMLRMNFLRKGNATDRFDREMKAAAKLDHPNIARVHDAEQLGDLHFLVMEYVEGETLAEIVSRGPLPVADACRAIRDAARGLAHAHKARLIHRDIKPGNMIRTPAGEVKLLDFGLVVSPEDAISLTGPNLVMGTPDYISPEQAEDPHAADERSDIYSLGCTLYHLLSGHVPFPVTSTVRKIDAHRSGELTPIPSIPGTLMAIVSRMMARNPADRFQTADKVVLAMESFLTPGATALTDPMQAETRIEFANDGPGLPMGIGKRWLVFACTSIVMFALVAYRFANHLGKEYTLQQVAVQNELEESEFTVRSRTTSLEVLKDTANKSQGLGRVGVQRNASAGPLLAQKIPREGFNPDIAETRVARLYYCRDAHRVAEIINRNIRSSKQATGTLAERRTDAATDERLEKERAAIRAAEQAINAEGKLAAAKETLAEVQELQNSITDDESIKTALEEKRNETTDTSEKTKLAEQIKQLESQLTQQKASLAQFGGDSAVTELKRNVSSMEQSVGNLRQTAIVKQKESDQFDSKESRASAMSPATYVTGSDSAPVTPSWNSIDPVTQCSISVIGEGLIQISGSIKGIDKIRTMINQITDFKHRLIGHTALVMNALFSSDSRQLFTGSDDGTVRVWDVASGNLVGMLNHRDSNANPVRIKGLALADRGATLITAQDDRLRLWDIASRTEIPGAFEVVSPDELEHISSNNEGTQVAAGSLSGNIRVWDISSRKLICESAALSEDSNYSAVWIPGRPELLVADGEYLEILNVPSNERRVLFTNSVLLTNSDRYCTAAVSRDGNTLAGVCFSSEVTLLDGNTGDCKSKFWSGAGRIQFLPDGRLVTASIDRNTDIWDSSGKTRLATFLGGMSEALSLAVSPDGRFIASAGDDNSILIWNVPDTPLLNN